MPIPNRGQLGHCSSVQDHDARIRRIVSMNIKILAIASALGLFASGAFSQEATSSTTIVDTATPAKGSSEVGISAQDGISLSGTDVMVTRNGVTEKVGKELILPNGIHVMPDGTVLTSEGNKFTLRATQTLTFDGKLIDTAAKTIVPTTTTSTTQTTTSSTSSPSSSAETISAAEAERRQKAADSDAGK